jgi:hypothetical protein
MFAAPRSPHGDGALGAGARPSALTSSKDRPLIVRGEGCSPHGSLRHPGQLHRPPRSWPHDRSCTNIHPGPPDGGRPGPRHLLTKADIRSYQRVGMFAGASRPSRTGTLVMVSGPLRRDLAGALGGGGKRGCPTSGGRSGESRNFSEKVLAVRNVKDRERDPVLKACDGQQAFCKSYSACRPSYPTLASREGLLGRLSMRTLTVAAMALAAMTSVAFAEPGGEQVIAQAAPMQLTAEQMDRVTAGGVEVDVGYPIFLMGFGSTFRYEVAWCEGCSPYDVSAPWAP